MSRCFNALTDLHSYYDLLANVLSSPVSKHVRHVNNVRSVVIYCLLTVILHVLYVNYLWIVLFVLSFGGQTVKFYKASRNLLLNLFLFQASVHVYKPWRNRSNKFVLDRRRRTRWTGYAIRCCTRTGTDQRVWPLSATGHWKCQSNPR